MAHLFLFAKRSNHPLVLKLVKGNVSQLFARPLGHKQQEHLAWFGQPFLCLTNMQSV